MFLELLARFGKVGSVMAAPALFPGQRTLGDQQRNRVDVPEFIAGALGASNRLERRGFQRFTGTSESFPGANDPAALPGQSCGSQLRSGLETLPLGHSNIPEPDAATRNRAWPLRRVLRRRRLPAANCWPGGWRRVRRCTPLRPLRRGPEIGPAVQVGPNAAHGIMRRGMNRRRMAVISTP